MIGDELPGSELQARVAQLEQELATCRRQAGETEAHRRLLDTMIAQAPVGLMLLDGADLRVRWHNPLYRGFFEDPGLPDDLAGLLVADFIPGFEETGVLGVFRTVAQTGKPVSLEAFEYTGFARGPTYWRWVNVPVPRPEPGAHDVLVMLVEATEQVKARQEVEKLAEAAESRAAELDTIINSIADGVTISDAEGRLIRYNEAAHRMLRYEGYEGASQSRRAGRCEYYRPDGSEFALADLPLSRSLRGETVTGEIIRMVFADGDSTWVNSSSAPLRDAAGALVGAVLTTTDVTGLRRQAREREQLLEDLAAERATLKAIIDTAPSGLLVTDAEGRIVLANPAAERLYAGRVPYGQPVSGHAELGLHHPDGTPYDPARLPLLRSVLWGETHTNVEMMVVWPDGQKHFLLANSAPIRGEGGRIAGAVSLCRDVTEIVEARQERERLLEQVQAERERLFAVLSMFPAYVCVLTPEHECTFANRRFVELFGEGTPGQKCHELRFGRSEPCEDCRSFDCLATGEPQVWEWTSPAGACFEVYDYPFTEADGSQSVLEVGFDITERKLAAEEPRRHRDHLEELVRERGAALAERSRVLESVFQNSLSSLVLLDPEFGFVRVNEAYARACARPPEDFIGHNHFVDYPSDELRGAFEEVARSHEPWQVFARPFVFPDHPDWGVTHWDLSVVPILDTEGRTEYVLFSLADVTERQRAQEQLLRYQEDLRSLASELGLAEARERERLAAGIHDEIGQSLAFSKMKLSSLRCQEQPREADEAIGGVVELLTQVIQYTRDLQFDLSPPLLTQLGLEAAIDSLAERMARRHGFSAQVTDDGQPKPLSEDVRLVLFRAVRELLTNVAKHAGATTVEVTLAREGPMVAIRVRDDGVGFAPEDVRPGEGGGFGLFSLRERLMHLGGELEIGSRPGAGTCFTIRAPLSEEEGARA